MQQAYLVYLPCQKTGEVLFASKERHVSSTQRRIEAVMVAAFVRMGKTNAIMAATFALFHNLSLEAPDDGAPSYSRPAVKCQQALSSLLQKG